MTLETAPNPFQHEADSRRQEISAYLQSNFVEQQGALSVYHTRGESLDPRFSAVSEDGAASQLMGFIEVGSKFYSVTETAAFVDGKNTSFLSLNAVPRYKEGHNEAQVVFERGQLDHEVEDSFLGRVRFVDNPNGNRGIELRDVPHARFFAAHEKQAPQKQDERKLSFGALKRTLQRLPVEQEVLTPNVWVPRARDIKGSLEEQEDYARTKQETAEGIARQQQIEAQRSQAETESTKAILEEEGVASNPEMTAQLDARIRPYRERINWLNSREHELMKKDVRSMEEHQEIHDVQQERARLIPEAMQLADAIVDPFVRERVAKLSKIRGIPFEKMDIDWSKLRVAELRGTGARMAYLGQLDTPSRLTSWGGSSAGKSSPVKGSRVSTSTGRVIELAKSMLVEQWVPGTPYHKQDERNMYEQKYHTIDARDRTGRTVKIPVYETGLGNHRPAAEMALYGPFATINLYNETNTSVGSRWSVS